MIKFGNLADEVLNTSNEAELFDLMSRLLNDEGYDNLVISSFDRSGPRVFQHNTPSGWETTYFEKKFWQVDPAFKVQQQLWQPHTWKSIVPSDPGPKVREFIGISEECGLKHGATASASIFGRKLNFAVSSSYSLGQNFEERMLPQVSVLAAIYAARVETFQNQNPSLHLSHRQKELTELIVCGMTNGEIASKMNISKKTVEEMIRRILIKNNLSGRVQIAISAILNGIVNL